MKPILLTAFMILLATTVKAQIITRYITPDNLPVIIPGYAEVFRINTKTIDYTPPTPPTPPPPVDEDTTNEGNGVYYYGTPLVTNISMSDGNYTTTSQGKVWTCRISIPNAKNIGLLCCPRWCFHERSTPLLVLRRGVVQQPTNNTMGTSPQSGCWCSRSAKARKNTNNGVNSGIVFAKVF